MCLTPDTSTSNMFSEMLSTSKADMICWTLDLSVNGTLYVCDVTVLVPIAVRILICIGSPNRFNDLAASFVIRAQLAESSNSVLRFPTEDGIDWIAKSTLSGSVLLG